MTPCCLVRSAGLVSDTKRWRWLPDPWVHWCTTELRSQCHGRRTDVWRRLFTLSSADLHIASCMSISPESFSSLACDFVYRIGPRKVYLTLSVQLVYTGLVCALMRGFEEPILRLIYTNGRLPQILFFIGTLGTIISTHAIMWSNKEVSAGENVCNCFFRRFEMSMRKKEGSTGARGISRSAQSNRPTSMCPPLLHPCNSPPYFGRSVSSIFAAAPKFPPEPAVAHGVHNCLGALRRRVLPHVHAGFGHTGGIPVGLRGWYVPY